MSDLKVDDWVWCGISWFPTLKGTKITKAGRVADYHAPETGLELPFRIFAVNTKLADLQIKLPRTIWEVNNVDKYNGYWNIGKRWWRACTPEEIAKISVYNYVNSDDSFSKESISSLSFSKLFSFLETTLASNIVLINIYRYWCILEWVHQNKID